MSQIWKGSTVIPVTVVQAGPVVVTQVKTKESDGYAAVQVGFGLKKKLSRPMKGHLKELGSFQYLREYRPKSGEIDPALSVGSAVDVSVFLEGDAISIAGTSKGRGFQGVVKRHGFGGGPRSHGQKHRLRAPGSIGSTAPQRVVPGRKMAGHMGVTRVTVRNLTIAGVDKEKNQLFIKGATPGNRGGLLEVYGK